ncbi:MAG: phytanoyl-CoA dioxygenase family protein [Paracoccaceae bacterium]
MDVRTAAPAGFYAEDDCDVEDFKTLVASQVASTDVPNAARIERNVPIYDVDDFRGGLEHTDTRDGLMAEWARILMSGAGVFVLKAAFADTTCIDQATQAYNEIIQKEKQGAGTAADHFAPAGSNDRIWNSLQKLCTEAPETFVRYFANPAIDAACEAWLGPNYQMTAQVNLVRPGGQAQEAHRDYHLGFQTAEKSAQYPVHVHDLSPLMTLQGGIAHCDMSVEGGPTKLLPFSQLYRPGYAAWRRPDFRAVFEEHYVQLSSEKGDAIFFNPALFHAAGENRSKDIDRMVNLMQISSAFGRSLENIDRIGMCKTAFSHLVRTWSSMSTAEFNAILASTAEGYPFPTNLDTDPPVGGLAPKSQKELLKEAVQEGADANTFFAKLDALLQRQKA